MLDFHTHLLQVRIALGMSQQALATRLGYSRSYYNQIEKGKVKPGRGLESILETLEKEAGAGNGGVQKTNIKVFEFSSASMRLKEDAPSYGNELRNIPVISWADTAKAEVYEELPLSLQERIASDCSDPKAFALSIQGDSMEPLFKEGDVITAMPSLDPRNGCLVIAKGKADGLLFKLFHAPRFGVIQLSSYNPVYPAIQYAPQDFAWIYPVHSLTRRLWK